MAARLEQREQESDTDPGAAKSGRHQERLKILRLDLQTITRQIKLLEQEMELDPCLSSDAIAVIHSLVATLKQDLEETRCRIQELKTSMTAYCT